MNILQFTLIFTLFFLGACSDKDSHQRHQITYYDSDRTEDRYQRPLSVAERYEALNIEEEIDHSNSSFYYDRGTLEALIENRNDLSLVLEIIQRSGSKVYLSEKSDDLAFASIPLAKKYDQFYWRLSNENARRIGGKSMGMFLCDTPYSPEKNPRIVIKPSKNVFEVLLHEWLHFSVYKLSKKQDCHNRKTRDQMKQKLLLNLDSAITDLREIAKFNTFNSKEVSKRIASLEEPLSDLQESYFRPLLFSAMEEMFIEKILRSYNVSNDNWYFNHNQKETSRLISQIASLVESFEIAFADPSFFTKLYMGLSDLDVELMNKHIRKLRTFLNNTNRLFHTLLNTSS